MKTLTMPTVHLNGTSKDALLKGYVDATEAISRALNVLVRSAPNARDYYVQGPDAYGKARDEHDARCAKLRDVNAELTAIVEHFYLVRA